MKKIFIISSLVLLACNKESGKSVNNNPLQVSVTDASALMKVSWTGLNSNDVIDVQFADSADSVIWWVTDSAHGGTIHCDSIINYPTHSDSLQVPPADTIYPQPYIPVPVDSSRFPGDTVGTPPVIPPVDSSRYPADTIINLPPPNDSAYHPADSTRNGNNVFAGYYYSTNKTRMTLGIRQSGTYLVSAAAYHKNADGSFTLTKTGYVRLSAR